MYTFLSRVRYSETDCNRKMTPYSMVNYFQDCSNFQSEDLSIGIDYLNENHHFWILSSWQIDITRFPELNEYITIGTWPYNFDSMYGYRNFIMYDMDKNTVAVANSIWILIDTTTGRPIRLKDYDTSAYQLEPAYPMEYLDRKIKTDSLGEEKPSFTVLPTDLDAMHHVNNGQYIRYAQEYLPNNAIITRVQVEYRKSALLHDTIIPVVSINNHQCVVSLMNEKQSPYAIVSFDIK